MSERHKWRHFALGLQQPPRQQPADYEELQEKILIANSTLNEQQSQIQSLRATVVKLEKRLQQREKDLQASLSILSHAGVAGMAQSPSELRLQVGRLQRDLRARQDEIDRLNRSSKLTQLREVEIEMDECKREISRLSGLLAETRGGIGESLRPAPISAVTGEIFAGVVALGVHSKPAHRNSSREELPPAMRPELNSRSHRAPDNAKKYPAVKRTARLAAHARARRVAEAAQREEEESRRLKDQLQRIEQERRRRLAQIDRDKKKIEWYRKERLAEISSRKRKTESTATASAHMCLEGVHIVPSDAVLFLSVTSPSEESYGNLDLHSRTSVLLKCSNFEGMAQKSWKLDAWTTGEDGSNCKIAHTLLPADLAFNAAHIASSGASIRFRLPLSWEEAVANDEAWVDISFSQHSLPQLAIQWDSESKGVGRHPEQLPVPSSPSVLREQGDSTRHSEANLAASAESIASSEAEPAEEELRDYESPDEDEAMLASVSDEDEIGGLFAPDGSHGQAGSILEEPAVYESWGETGMNTDESSTEHDWDTASPLAATDEGWEANQMVLAAVEVDENRIPVLDKDFIQREDAAARLAAERQKLLDKLDEVADEAAPQSVRSDMHSDSSESGEEVLDQDANVSVEDYTTLKGEEQQMDDAIETFEKGADILPQSACSEPTPRGSNDEDSTGIGASPLPQKSQTLPAQHREHSAAKETLPPDEKFQAKRHTLIDSMSRFSLDGGALLGPDGSEFSVSVGSTSGQSDESDFII
jgi:hypothetical protein